MGICDVPGAAVQKGPEQVAGHPGDAVTRPVRGLSITGDHMQQDGRRTSQTMTSFQLRSVAHETNC